MPHLRITAQGQAFVSRTAPYLPNYSRMKASRSPSISGPYSQPLTPAGGSGVSGWCAAAGG